MKIGQAGMRRTLVGIPLGLSLTIRGCGVYSIGGNGCSYKHEGANIIISEVTDSLGTVYEVERVEMAEDRGDKIEVCGVPRRAAPAQVGDKYFFTAKSGVNFEAVALEPSYWRLVGGPQWD